MNEFEFTPESSSIEQSPETERFSPPSLSETANLAAFREPMLAGEKRSKKTPRVGPWIATTAISLVLALAMGGLSLWISLHPKTVTYATYDVPQSNTPAYSYRDDVETGDAMTSQEIIRKLTPSVVTVTVSKNGATAGFGSGIIYTDDGYIVTNAHVISGAQAVSVKTHDKKTYNARIVGYDSDSDVGVLKIEATDLTPAEFGKSSETVPGDRVIAIGTPYVQSMEYTATEGIVSALRSNEDLVELGYTLNLIQHDAAINSGNSGGPLINVYGQVIGINTIKISGTYENLGFALQIDEVVPLVEQLMTTGKVVRPAIGIVGSTYRGSEYSGVYVHSLTDGGPAAAAGLREGDIILKVNEQTVSSINQIKNYLNTKKIGDTVTVTYVRNNEVRETSMKLIELKAE